MSYFRNAAISYLDTLAHDIHNGAKLWERVKPIETRFKLQGYVVHKVLRMDEAVAKAARFRAHQCLKRSPDNWWHRMPSFEFAALCQEFGPVN